LISLVIHNNNKEKQETLTQMYKACATALLAENRF